MGLAHLQAAEFLYKTRLFPVPSSPSSTQLTHEVAYSTLLQDRRKTLHARIVGAIERSLSRSADRARRPTGPPCRAGGAMGAGGRVPPSGRRQGPGAIGQPGGGEAASSSPWPLLSHLPETRERREQAIDLRFDLRTALHPIGEFERIVRMLLREAESLAQATRRSTPPPRADVRLHVSQPLDDGSSDGSARVRPERPGHRGGPRGRSAPGDGDSST